MAEYLVDQNGNPITSSNPLPVSASITGRTGTTPAGREDLTVDATAGGKALTPPVGATWATIALENAEIRYTLNGTAPTATVGTLMYVSDTLTLQSAAEIAGFRAFRTTATSGLLTVEYGS